MPKTYQTHNSPIVYTERYRKVCPACRKRIAMAISPDGKWMPFDTGSGEPHWSTCPAKKDFRKDKRNVRK